MTNKTQDQTEDTRLAIEKILGVSKGNVPFMVCGIQGASRINQEFDNAFPVYKPCITLCIAFGKSQFPASELTLITCRSTTIDMTLGCEWQKTDSTTGERIDLRKLSLEDPIRKSFPPFSSDIRWVDVLVIGTEDTMKVLEILYDYEIDPFENLDFDPPDTDILKGTRYIHCKSDSEPAYCEKTHMVDGEYLERRLKNQLITKRWVPEPWPIEVFDSEEGYEIQMQWMFAVEIRNLAEFMHSQLKKHYGINTGGQKSPNPPINPPPRI